LLTDTKLRSLKPRSTIYRVADEKGLAIEVRPTGGLFWRFRYRFLGKPGMLSLGRYPEISLKKARELRDQNRGLLTEGRDPSRARQEESAASRVASDNTFRTVAREWMKRQQVSKTTADKNRWLLEKYAIPEIGAIPIAEIGPRELLRALRKVEASGKLETAQRVRVKCGQVFRYAIIEGKADTDPTQALRGALKQPAVRHHATITEPKKIGALLRAIDGFDGHAVTQAALRLAPLVFVRPGELRKAEWNEFDLEGSEWRIPAHRMKMKAAHLVPLSQQAVEILGELKRLTGAGRLVFPSIRTLTRPMSENTVNAALRRLGYTKNEMTGHGFRAMASSRLNEMGWSPDAIERQLAHAESNKVRAAYTHAAEYLKERRAMMQAWADYLDSLRADDEVVAFN